MDSFKKCIAEFIGTFTLVLVGCGTAMLVGCDSASGCGYILTAFAFGLVIVGMAYCVGNVSGCHINPAVSLAVLISGKMSVPDFFLYFVSQVLGAISGAACLKIIFSLGQVTDKTGGLGSNGLAGVGGNAVAGLIVEILLTFIFVLVILSDGAEVALDLYIIIGDRDLSARDGTYNAFESGLGLDVSEEEKRLIRRSPGHIVRKAPECYALDGCAVVLSLDDGFEEALHIYTLIVK